MKRKLQKKDGFTLIEVLISLAVFAIIVIPVSMMVMQGVKTNKKAEEKQQAMMIVQNIMESIKGISDYDFSLNFNINVNGEEVVCEKGVLSGNVDGYEITGQVTPLEEYSFKNSNIKFDEEKNWLIYVYEEQSVLKVKFEGEDRIIIGNEIKICKENDGRISVSGKESKSISLGEMYLIINESCKNNIKISVENNSEVEQTINLIKKETSKSNYEINTIAGDFHIKEYIVNEDKEYEKQQRLYEIKIQANKKDQKFEVKSYKNIK